MYACEIVRALGCALLGDGSRLLARTRRVPVASGSGDPNSKVSGALQLTSAAHRTTQCDSERLTGCVGVDEFTVEMSWLDQSNW